MTEGERIQLYNGLCDFKEELEGISYPSQTSKIDLLRRAIEYVRNSPARWLEMSDSEVDSVVNEPRLPYMFPRKCSSCGFARGFSDFRLCPQCGCRMQSK